MRRLFGPVALVVFLFARKLFWSHLYSWFFFSSRRRHTRWPRDWSSDVCSSDLPLTFPRKLSGFRVALFRLLRLHGFSCVALRNSLLLENFLGNVNGVYRVRPATVERQVSDSLDQHLLSHAVFARSDEVRRELLCTMQGNKGCHEQDLAQRVGVPCGACARLERDESTRGPCRSVRLKQWIDAHGAGEILGQSRPRGLRTPPHDLYRSLILGSLALRT